MDLKSNSSIFYVLFVQCVLMFAPINYKKWKKYHKVPAILTSPENVVNCQQIILRVSMFYDMLVYI
jgi:hypothetical protein